MQYDEKYMRRALQLAAQGDIFAKPNPMVGAVIVTPDGKIIGEGYHRQWGAPHAEVNAVASVKNPSLLKDSTIYVTLEPCSHYGKTPPCAKLIIDSQIPRVVVGAGDPNEKVNGRGIAMLRDAGIEVASGVLARESETLNAKFMTAHTLHRPFVTLKWAQSSDGYLDKKRDSNNQFAAKISTAVSRMAILKLRAQHQAILIGSGTAIADNPRLGSGPWDADPIPVILDRRKRIDPHNLNLLREPIIINENYDIPQLLSFLFNKGIHSLLVEGGAEVLKSFIKADTWDIARIETSQTAFGNHGAIKAPVIGIPANKTIYIGGNQICFYIKNHFVDVKNL